MQVDRDHQVLGLAVTLLSTPHRIQLPGRSHLLYAWCIPDTLHAARVLGEPLQVTSTCPATDQPVVLEVEPDGMRAVDPPTAVMSWVTYSDPDDARATSCGHQNLFVSAEAATEFQAGYPHVVNVPVAEVFDVFAPVFDEFAERAGVR
jgi:alkylmercury lyase